MLPAQRTVLAVQILVPVGRRRIGLGHLVIHPAQTDEIVTYDHTFSQACSDEFLITEAIGKVSAMDTALPDSCDSPAEPVSRLQRRKMRTRAALIQAAQGFIAQGRLSVPILEITQAADVGMGSFYNHFDSKEALFAAAVTDVLDACGALLDAHTATIGDPAEAFATSFRLTGRLFRQRPQEAQLLLANGSS